MGNFFERLDTLAGISEKIGPTRWLDRAAFVFLVLMVLAAPHSIAATQAAWITGMFLWLVAAGIRRYRRNPADAPRESGMRSSPLVRPLNFLLWAFFGWSIITCLTSYAPDISGDKLRGAAVFLIFYFVYYQLRNFRAVRFAAFALIASCMVNVAWTPVERLIGRGVEIHGLAPDGPLAKVYLTEGDTLLAVNGRKAATPDEVVAEIGRSETSKIKFYRPDFEYTVEMKRSDLRPGSDALQQLGISTWKKSRNWRSSGFYGHYTTYAEMLQLVMSLALGLLVAAIIDRQRRPAAVMLLFVCIGLMCAALLLTVTRASQLAFLVSAFVIVAAAGSRKLLIWLAVAVIPLTVVGLIFLQQSRNVGFLDAKDDSTIYRETMWRDGTRIWLESPRNMVFGVGMDSVKRYWRDWGMFDGGRLPMGHFHSTLIQLLVERGLPSLVLWLGVAGLYAAVLWRGLRPQAGDAVFPESRYPASEGGEAASRGILLGCLGGTAGFLTSGLVHYNLGDQEVAMMFFLLMGLGVRTALLPRANPNPGQKDPSA